MMRHQRRMHSVGSMPMGFGGTPQQMAQLQMAAQQQQMALQMNPMNGQMMMSPQHSRSSSASSFSLNHSLRVPPPPHLLPFATHANDTLVPLRHQFQQTTCS